MRFLRKFYGQISPDIRSTISLSPNSSSDDASFMDFCDVLSEVGAQLKTNSNVSYGDIVEHLQANNRISNDDGITAFNIQLAFIAVGLITMIYSPSPDPEPNNMQILFLHASSRPSRDKAWALRELPVDKCTGSVADVILRLGGMRGPIPRPEHQNRTITFSEQDALKTVNLCYYSLTRLADIKVVWSDSIAEHLEFDRRMRTLKLFRFPSFCSLVSKGHAEKTFLCQ